MKVLILTQEQCLGFVWSVANPFSEDVVAITREDFDWNYDVGISFMWQKKIPKDQIDAHTWINFHPAPLPEYKGRNLCYHAIMNGETEFGATVHYMDEGFDTGDIIEVAKFKVPEWWNAEQLSKAAVGMSEQLFKVYLPVILENTVFTRFSNEAGHYYKKTDIIDTVPMKHDAPFAQFVRAVTYKQFYPKIDIDGVVYKIVREDD